MAYQVGCIVLMLLEQKEEGTAFIVITDDDIVIHITGALNI
jgi:hypothetical protein